MTLSVSFGAAIWFTFLVREYALRNGILDAPNHRSSHSVPTPRGGGAGLLGGVIAGAIAATLLGVVDFSGQSIALSLGGAAVLITAWVGWMDDQTGVPARIRILVHIAAGMLLLPMAGSTAIVPGLSVMGVLAAFWWIFATVSAINVVNFMDGIDGLIALQVFVIGVHLALLAGDPEPVHLALALSGAACGFLLFNWAPARIFLGDIGSGALGALGMLIGLMVLAEGEWPVSAVFLPLAPIFIDALVTLLRRAARGARIWEPHREHLYQRLANGGYGHGRVALLYGGISLIGSWAVLSGAWYPKNLMALSYVAAVGMIGWAFDARLTSVE